ncbi:MAG: helix-turn-helix transcriptional regulator [Eubacteriales bacterium]|nr:helix-turn-helix transcriptional regulator [Eubacteriales bacterium]
MSELKTNIRNLRKAWGLTQKELGEAIHVASNTVAMYEKGDRVPTVDILQDIASFLCVTVDQLIHEDFSRLDIQPTLITTETGVSYVKNLFPIIQSDSAMSDIHFRKGYLFSLNFWNNLSKGPLLESTLTTALEEYDKSLSKNGTIESAANILWVLFLKFIFLPDEYNQTVGEAIIHGKGKYKDFFRDYVLNSNKAVGAKTIELKHRFIEQHRDLAVKMIKQLKASSIYSDLGDYYLALSYIYGFIDNGRSYDTNQMVGIEIMSSLLVLDN